MKDWIINNGNNCLTSYGQQIIIDKINEIITKINKTK
jgi:hypothetical protein